MKGKNGKQNRIWIKRVLAMMIALAAGSAAVWGGGRYKTEPLPVDEAPYKYRVDKALLTHCDSNIRTMAGTVQIMEDALDEAIKERKEAEEALKKIKEPGAGASAQEKAAAKEAKEAAEAAFKQAQTKEREIEKLWKKSIQQLEDALAKYRSQYQQDWQEGHTNRKNGNIETGLGEEASNNSSCAGDPVRITRGTYLLEEMDLSIIKRSYTSGHQWKGSIGKVWVSGLDERIIHGIDAGASEYYRASGENKAGMGRLYEKAGGGKEKDQGHLSQLEKEAKIISEIYEDAVHIYERYRILTALNRYSVTRETPEYYWGCGNEKLVWVDAEGFPCIYEMIGRGVWEPLEAGKRQYSRIESRDGGGADSEAGFILYEKGGVKKYFNKWGLIEKVEYSPYEAIRYIRNDEQQAIRIEGPHNRNYQLKYNAGGNVSRVTDPAGRMVRYGYEGGILVSVMDEAGDEVRYEYSYDGLLEKIIKPDESRITVIYGETDGEGNAYVTATEDEEGNREQFEYHREEKYTVHRNHSGVVEKIWYDEQHRTVKEEKADGSVIVYEYDEKGNKKRVIENGLATNYEYDRRGNCISIRYADGSQEVFRYNERDQKTYAQDRDGVTAEWVYDRAGRCIAVRKAGTLIWEGMYDGSGRLTASKEADLGQKRYSYDANGFISSVSIRENGMEFTERYSNDAIGRVLRYEDGAGQVWRYEYEAKTVTEVTPLGLKKVYWYNNRKDLIAVEEKDSERNEGRLTQLSYDRRHLVKEVRDSARNVTRYEYRADGKVISEKRGAWEKKYEYDAAGRIAKVIQRKDGSSEVFETSAEYALQGADRIQVFTDGLGNKQVYRYDAWSRLTEQVNAAGESFKRQYSAGGALVTAQGAYGGLYRFGTVAGMSASFGKDGDSAVRRQYSPNGLLVSETDRDGKQTRYSYTERGLIKSISTDEGSITYAYDGAGRVIEQSAYTEANGHTYRSRYRYEGRTVTEERGAYTTTYALDGWGELILKTDGEGWSERYRYDGAGRISEVRDDIGLVAGYTYNELSLVASERHGTEIPIVYTYNAIGLLEKAERGNEILLARSYDKAGRLVREKRQGVPEKTYRYDALGRLTEVRSAGVVQAQYRYGSYGRTVTYTDGAGSEYLFEKDGYGLLTTEHDRLGNQRQYRYSKEDELTEAQGRNGGVRSVTRVKGSEITTYKDGSRYEITKDIAGAVIFEKGIDGEGKRTSEVTYRYDQGGLLVAAEDDAGDTRIIYRYNKAGYRTEMETNDRHVVYEVDGRGRVTEISDRKQYFKVRAFYDENNREIKRILGNGNKQDYTYDEAGRLLGIVETASNRAIIWAECYGYDGEGRRIFTADERGNLTRYIYDEQYRIKEVLYPASEELRAYHREEAKEVRLLIDEGAASHRREIMNPVELAQISATFSRLVGARTSNLGSMVNSIQLVWSEQYTYDANGNIATKTTPYGTIHYAYDKENRLLTRGAVHYTYDEEGNLLTEEQSGYYLKRYEYAGFNRMEASDIINYRDNTHVITDYRYDSFGRRIHTAERTKTGMRTIYDGLTFEVVKEAETFLGTRGITSSATGEANLNNYTPQVPQNGGPNNTAPSYGSDHTKGTRYYYIPDNAQGSQTRNNGGTTQSAPSYGSDHTKGTRYYYIPDNAQGTQTQQQSGSASNTTPPYPSDHTKGTRYYYIPDNAQGAQTMHSAMPADRTKGVRTYLYLNGERVAVNNLYNTNHGQYYYGSDILGSVKFVTGQGGQELKRIEYDIFGGIYKGNSPYGLETGYTGKPYDSVTGLSDYGFRDYSPAHARFITEDPIRDGENWFAYVGNNPVNWVDPWGLSPSDGVSETLENTASVLGIASSLDGGSKIATGLIESGQSLMTAGNKVAWGEPYGQGWKKGMQMLFDGSKTAKVGEAFSNLGKVGKYGGIIGTGLQVVQAEYELRKGNTRYAVGIGGNIVGGQLGAKAGFLFAGAIITATGVGAPVGIAITVIAVWFGSYIFGKAGEATGKALYDLTDKGLLR